MHGTSYDRWERSSLRQKNLLRLLYPQLGGFCHLPKRDALARYSGRLSFSGTCLVERVYDLSTCERCASTLDALTDLRHRKNVSVS
jgi:hypothetical protein